MITWEVTEEKHQIDRYTYWGTSDAQQDREVLQDFQELWLKLFESQLAIYPAEKWNTLICGLIIDRGSFSLTPAMDFDLMKQLSGCRLDLPALEAYIDECAERSDEEFVRACDEEEERYAALLMEAWAAISAHPAVCAVLQHRSIPFRVITSPEDNAEPLLETMLR